MLAAAYPSLVHAQRRVRAELREAGHGAAARLLRDVLAAPHVAVLAGVPTLGLPRDTTFRTTLVVIGGDVTVASHIAGDLVVVGGDLFLHPGARISGRAVAIGGGVYDSFLAYVGGGRIAFREVTYDAAVVDGGRVLLDQRSLIVTHSSPIAWPGVYGLRLPTYDRVNGLSLPAGPRLSLPSAPLVAEPLLTYRSQLGVLDPSLDVTLEVGRRATFQAVAERGTYTNDAWARSDVLNSAATLVFGDDERNYYRGTRYGTSASITREWEHGTGTARLGLRSEDARSVGPTPGTASGPWSLLGRDDTTRMLRPNPTVLPGRIVSVLPALESEWSYGDLTARAWVGVEVPLSSVRDERFVQATADARIAFTTTADHRFEGQLHVVLTTGDAAPPQRWAYLGGGSTLPTFGELSMGGDQLLFMDGVYEVPIPRLEIPFVGPPTVGVRYAVGAAGVGRLPRLEQNIGILARLSLLRLELVVDPARGTTALRVGASAFR